MWTLPLGSPDGTMRTRRCSSIFNRPRTRGSAQCSLPGAVLYRFHAIANTTLLYRPWHRPPRPCVSAIGKCASPRALTHRAHEYSNAGTSRGLVRTQTTCYWVACVRCALGADVWRARRRWNNAWSTFLSVSQVLYGQSCLLHACMHRFAGCVPIPEPLRGTCVYTKI